MVGQKTCGKKEKLLVTSMFPFSHDVFDWVFSSQDRQKPSLCSKRFNSLPNDKILDWSKFKAFADDKINVTEKLNFVLGRVESIFSFSHDVFKRLFIQGR